MAPPIPFKLAPDSEGLHFRVGERTASIFGVQLFSAAYQVLGAANTLPSTQKHTHTHTHKHRTGSWMIYQKCFNRCAQTPTTSLHTGAPQKIWRNLELCYEAGSQLCPLDQRKTFSFDCVHGFKGNGVGECMAVAAAGTSYLRCLHTYRHIRAESFKPTRFVGCIIYGIFE